MLGVEEIRRRLIGAGQLAHDIRRGPVAEAAEIEALHVDRRAAGVDDRLPIEPLGRREGGRIDAQQAEELVLRLRPGRGAAGWAEVTEPGTQTGILALV